MERQRASRRQSFGETTINLSASLILITSGAACLGLCGLLLYAAVPRAGRRESSLVSTEGRATSVALLVIILLIAGFMLLVKGVMQ